VTGEPPPGVIAAAEQDLHEYRDRVSNAVLSCQLLLARGVPELYVFTEIYYQLTRMRSRQHAAALAAAAVVRLAKDEREAAPGRFGGGRGETSAQSGGGSGRRGCERSERRP